MKLCKNCQCEIIEGNQFCTKCGTQVEIPENEGETLCSNCNNLILENDSFCRKCGAKVQNMNAQNSCPNCNNPISEENAFCTVCGTKITSGVTNDEAKLDAKQISNKLNRFKIEPKLYLLTFILSALAPLIQLLPQISFSADFIIVNYDESYNWFTIIKEVISELDDGDAIVIIFSMFYIMFFVMEIIHSIFLLSPWISNNKMIFSELEKKARKCRLSTIGLVSLTLLMCFIINEAIGGSDGVSVGLTIWGYLFFISSISSIIMMFIGISRKNNYTS